MKLLPSPDEIKEAGIGDVTRYWKSNLVYTFRMPDNVEVFVSLRDGVEILVKAPRQSGQSGWCGNANDDDTDDKEEDTMAYKEVTAADDLFAGTPVALDQWKDTFKDVLESQADETPPNPNKCTAALRRKAESA